MVQVFEQSCLSAVLVCIFVVFPYLESRKHRHCRASLLCRSSGIMSLSDQRNIEALCRALATREHIVSSASSREIE